MIKIKELKVNSLRVNDEVKYKIQYIQDSALDNNYKIKYYYARSGKLIIEKTDVLISINLKNNSVITLLSNHPKWIKSKLKRENLELHQIRAIIKNPRIHLSKGVFLEKQQR